MDGQQRWRAICITAMAAALLVVVQHVLAHRAELTYWGPYEAGAEEVPPLDVALSAWFLGTGAAVLSCWAVARRRLRAGVAATVVFVSAMTTVAVALAWQGISLDAFAGHLSWPELLVPHAVAALLGSIAGFLAARHEVGMLPLAGWGVLWVWTMSSALEGVGPDALGLLLLVPLVATVVLVGVAVGRARRRGAGRGPLAGAVVLMAVLPEVVFALAQSKLWPHYPGFEVDDTHFAALIWAGLALLVGVLATLLPPAPQGEAPTAS